MQRSFDGLPKNHFGAILIDPPWTYKTWSAKGKGRSAEQHYACYGNDDLAALPIADIAASNCTLFCWVTWPLLPQCLDVIRRWQFTYKACAFDWLKLGKNGKPSFGMGYWTRQNTEICLLATRGKPKRLHADVRQPILAPRREHSRKPDIHEKIERLVAGPYIELFARESTRPGWTFWGAEKDKFNDRAQPTSAG